MALLTRIKLYRAFKVRYYFEKKNYIFMKVS